MVIVYRPDLTSGNEKRPSLSVSTVIGAGDPGVNVTRTRSIGSVVPPRSTTPSIEPGAVCWLAPTASQNRRCRINIIYLQIIDTPWGGFGSLFRYFVHHQPV